MKLAIMQPYFFPYLGYFQLISSVDKFVIYDDVSFIKQGWINRNQLLSQGRPHLFSVPLSGVSSNRPIRETQVSERDFPRWREKFLRTIDQAYAKAPEYQNVRPFIASVLETTPSDIARLALRSIYSVAEYLGIDTSIEFSSSIYDNDELSAQTRVLDICRIENATLYVNAEGGRELYQHHAFNANNIDLRFIKCALRPYRQFENSFVAGLSILDVMMFNPIDEITGMLQEFTLEP